MGVRVLARARSWCHDSLVGKPAVDVHALSKAERLQLLEELWESLEPEEDVPVTEVQRQELARRSRALSEGKLGTVGVERLLQAVRTRRVPD